MHFSSRWREQYRRFAMTAKTALRFLFALLVSFLGFAANAQTTSPSVNSAAASPGTAVSFGKLPLSFEPNRGQTSKEVQWLARGAEYTLYLAGHDAVLEMNAITPAKNAAGKPTISESALRMNLLGANVALNTNGEEPLAGRANYFTGKDSSKWQRDVPMFGKVKLSQVYPGIDLVYYGRQGRLEYDFVVAPGTDASAIRMSFDGAKAKLAANGDLVLPVAGTEVRFDKPMVYQMKDGVRQPVEGSFTIAENRQVSFKVGSYDKARELVIDPTLIFLGALGTGNQQSVPNGMAVDAAGEIILTGITNDLNFPVTSGALQTSCQNASAAFTAGGYQRCGASSASSGFVTKISGDGTSLVYSTYLHGLSGAEYGDAVAADTAGDAYVLGMTNSNDFPITVDAFQSTCQPVHPASGPIQSTCDGNFAGGGTEFVFQGPTLFIVKLNPAGSQILYGTFFGGTIPTYPVGLALDGSNNIYFASYLQNAEPANNIYPATSTVPFPVTSSAYQSAGVGVQSATLSKLSADGHTLLYSTLMGGITTNTFFGYTQPLALAVGPNGIAYIGGVTLTASFPTTPGVVRPACVPATPSNGDCIAYTGFLSAFDTTKSGAGSLVYSTYIGGTETAAGNTAQNQVNGLAADGSNNVYVTGFTNRIDYPTTAGAYQTTCGHNNGDNTCGVAFLSKINPPGTGYVWSTLLGGTTANPANTQGNAIALDSKARVYLYGQSNDGGGDFPVVNPLQGYFGGNKLFVATFSTDGSQLLFSTRLGNTSTTAISSEQPIANNGIAVDAVGNIYVSGETGDGGSLVTTSGTYKTTATNGFFRGLFAKISPVMPATTMTLTITPTTAATGQKVTFTVKVAGTTQTTPAPSGTVTLMNNSNPGTVLGTITLDGTGAGSFSSTTLAAGTYSVTASYSGDTTYDTSAAAAQTLTITSLPATTTALTVSPTGALTYGQQVTLTATVTQSSGTPTGTVTFTEGTIVLGTGTLNASGVATLTTTVPAGTGALVATYGGSSSSATSTGPSVGVIVAKANLAVVAASVSRVIGKANPTLTGTVTGTVNNDVLTPSFTTAATTASPVGTYPIVPAITGANVANYSVTLTNGTLTVTPPTASTTVLTASATPVVVGASVTFTATVTPASGTPTPTGVVTFKDGTAALGTGTLNAAGVATFAATALAVGSHSVTASYAGDTSNSASVSSAVTVVVTAGPPDFAIALTPTSGTVTNGTDEVLTVTLTPSNGFNAATNLACSGLPSFSSCFFNPASVTPNGTVAATSTLTISTDVKAAAKALHLASDKERRSVRPRQGSVAIAGVLASVFLLPLAGWKNRRLRKLLAICVIVAAATLATVGMTGCGAGTAKTPAGTYSVIVTGTSGSLSHAATYSITVQ
jgi:hypothetical protein